jgi:hypothetical protein
VLSPCALFSRAALLGIVLTAICSAQLESGRVVGTVTDPNQAAVPRATVTVTNSATKEALTVTTNEQGDYTVTPLSPGIYSVSVTAPGVSDLGCGKR